MQIYELMKIIHDALIIGIYFESKDQLIIQLETDQHLKLKIEFSGVEFFRFTDFCDQNIISRLNLLMGDKFSEIAAKEYLKWVTSSSDSKSYLNEKTLDNFIIQIKSDQLQLVHFEPSCGVEGVIVYKSLKIIEYK